MSDSVERPRPDWAQFVRLAWTSTIGASARMKLLFLSAAILSVMFGFAERWALAGLGSLFEHLSPAMTLLASVPIAVSWVTAVAVLLAPVAVAVHRFVLLDEVAPGFSVLRQSCIPNFVWWTAGIQIAISAIDILRELPSGWFFGVLGFAGFVILFTRTLLVFPAIAIEAPSNSAVDRIEASLSASRGLFWVTLFGVVVATLPLNVVGFVPRVVAIWMPNSFLGLELVSAVMDDFVRPFIAAVLAALASWLYLWAQEYPFQASEPPPPSLQN